MRGFCDFVIVDCAEMGLALNEATLQSLTLAGAAAYLLRQSAVVTRICFGRQTNFGNGYLLTNISAFRLSAAKTVTLSPSTIKV